MERWRAGTTPNYLSRRSSSGSGGSWDSSRIWLRRPGRVTAAVRVTRARLDRGCSDVAGGSVGRGPVGRPAARSPAVPLAALGPRQPEFRLEQVELRHLEVRV